MRPPAVFESMFGATSGNAADVSARTMGKKIRHKKIILKHIKNNLPNVYVEKISFWTSFVYQLCCLSLGKFVHIPALLYGFFLIPSKLTSR